MLINGWGNYPLVEAKIFKPVSFADCIKTIQAGQVTPRGMGRSYGDSASGQRILQTTYLNHYINFDSENGILTCEAGITLREILNLIVPKGWFLPVTPGTSFVSIGGAVASDVHGKNHHIAGTFCQHVKELTIMLATGEIVTTSPKEKTDLFYATCGGMGLTGLILTASIELKAIQSSNIIQKTYKANCLEAIYDHFEASKNATYSVAWIDSLAKGQKLGRSLLMTGEHSTNGELVSEFSKRITLPIYMPSQILNKHTVKAFNTLYYAKNFNASTKIMPFQSYFYPLDRINNWNKLYGRSGFLQYQFVLPKSAGISGMRRILMKISDAGTGSFLAVLKMFGSQNKNILSFPMDGYTLALDFKMNAENIALIKHLDHIVLELGGRIYLTKDALMSESTFKASYSNWEKFENIREKYNAIGQFSSTQSKRLGLL